MSEEIVSKIRSSFEESISLKEKILDERLHQILEEIGDLVAKAINRGGKLMVCGNGGSAADAQHLVAEFLVRLTPDVNRQGIPAMTLLQDSSTFTACINDYSSEEIFSRNLLTLAGPEDILLVISTSGNSPNIVKVLEASKEINITSIGFLGGNGGPALDLCNISFTVPSTITARIQEVHITAGHAVMQYVEDKLMMEGFLSKT